MINFTSYMCSMSIGVSVRRRRVVHKVHTSLSTALEQVVSVINTTTHVQKYRSITSY